jgi:hypothetical protein
MLTGAADTGKPSPCGDPAIDRPAVGSTTYAGCAARAIPGSFGTGGRRMDGQLRRDSTVDDDLSRRNIMSAATSTPRTPRTPRTPQHGGAAPWADAGWGGAMAFTGPVHMIDEDRAAEPRHAVDVLRAMLGRFSGTARSQRAR